MEPVVVAVPTPDADMSLPLIVVLAAAVFDMTMITAADDMVPLRAALLAEVVCEMLVPFDVRMSLQLTA